MAARENAVQVMKLTPDEAMEAGIRLVADNVQDEEALAVIKEVFGRSYYYIIVNEIFDRLKSV